jgi:Ran GTPase-activating protein (RanGAP) involved in mRNA processing and transport
MSECEAFKTAYAGACEKLEIKSIELLERVLDDGAEGGTPLGEIVLRGNSREMFHRRVLDLDLEAIIMALQSLPDAPCNTLDLSWNDISDAGIAKLAEFLKTDERIMRLDLSYNQMGEQGANAMAEMLTINKRLFHLYLTGNKVGDIGGLALAQAIGNNTTLRTAELGNMDLGHKTFTMLGISLKNEYLNVSRLNLDRPVLFSCQEESIEHLAMGFRYNKSVQSFSMRNASLRDRGCYLLCDNLCLNSTLQELDLASNKLTEDAGTSLCKLLSDNGRIQRLNLANNELHDRGCEHLSVALADYPNVMDLDLAYNGIMGYGLLKLVEALHQHNSLESLRLWGNELDPESTAALALLCERMDSLRECDVLVQMVDHVPMPVLKQDINTSYFPGRV